MDTPPTDLTPYRRRHSRTLRATSGPTREPTRRPDSHLSARLDTAISNQTPSDKIRLGSGGRTPLRPQLAAAQPYHRPTRQRIAWLSVVVAVAGHAIVTGGLMTGRVDPAIGIAIVLGSTVCSLLLIVAEAIQRRSHRSDMNGVSE